MVARWFYSSPVRYDVWRQKCAGIYSVRVSLCALRLPGFQTSRMRMRPDWPISGAAAAAGGGTVAVNQLPRRRLAARVAVIDRRVLLPTGASLSHAQRPARAPMTTLRPRSTAPPLFGAVRKGKHFIWFRASVNRVASRPPELIGCQRRARTL